MACCMIGALLIFQITAAWRRVRTFFGLPADGSTVPSEGFITWARRSLRKPILRGLAIALLSLETGFAGNLIYEHRDHLTAEIRQLAYGPLPATGICTSTPAGTPAMTHPIERAGGPLP